MFPISSFYHCPLSLDLLICLCAISTASHFDLLLYRVFMASLIEPGDLSNRPFNFIPDRRQAVLSTCVHLCVRLAIDASIYVITSRNCCTIYFNAGLRQTRCKKLDLDCRGTKYHSEQLWNPNGMMNA